MKIENLVFEGGGVKGIAYVGALQALREKGILKGIKKVGGTSAGAINALLVGLNFTQDEIKEILWTLDFNSFKDDSIGLFRDVNRLMTEYGWYRGDVFKAWIENLITKKTGFIKITFKELKGIFNFKSLYFVGTNLSTGQSEIFSHEHTPNMIVADAIRISMSIPLFFKSVKYNNSIYVDGGVLNNYPIRLFDDGEPNSETLGFRLDSKKEIAILRDGKNPTATKINDIGDYVETIMKTLLEAQQNVYLGKKDWDRTVYINTLGVGAIDFDITDEKKNELITAGKLAVERHFDIE